MSPAYKKNVLGIHFTWKPETEKVMNLLPQIEKALRRFNHIPHWSKLFVMSPLELQSRYPRFNDFRELLKKYDPSGKWRNQYLDRFIFSVQSNI